DPGKETVVTTLAGAKGVLVELISQLFPRRRPHHRAGRTDRGPRGRGGPGSRIAEEGFGEGRLSGCRALSRGRHALALAPRSSGGPGPPYWSIFIVEPREHNDRRR